MAERFVRYRDLKEVIAGERPMHGGLLSWQKIVKQLPWGLFR
jgi:hypothetical protein